MLGFIRFSLFSTGRLARTMRAAAAFHSAASENDGNWRHNVASDPPDFGG
jgi:hypothetical protein